MKVEADRQANVTKKLVADAVAAFGLTLGEWQQVEEGIGNVVVFVTDAKTGDEYYLKFYKTTSNREIVEREVAFTRSLETYGVPVAQYETCLDGGFVYTVPHHNGVNCVTLTHKIAGTHPSRYTPRLIRTLARQHAVLHQVGIKQQTGRIFKHHEYYHYLPAGADDIALRDLQVILGRIMTHVDEAWSGLPSGLVHLDLDRGNLLAVGDTITGIIDFDDLSLAPFTFCLAGTLWDVLESGGSERDVQTYLRYYEEAGRTLTDAERSILPDMILMRGWVALHALFFGEGRTSVASERTLRLLDQACKNGVTVAASTAASL